MNRRLRGALAPVLALAATVALQLQDPAGIFSGAREAVFDAYQRLAPRVYQPVPVRVVDVDDESLRRYGQWPWPRDRLAGMTTRLAQAGAAAIGFDMVFAEPDRSSPAQIKLMWRGKADDAALQALDAMPDHDEIFAQSVAAAGNVALGFVGAPSAAGPAPLAKAGVAAAGDPPDPFLPNFAGAVVNLPILERAAAGNGAFNFTPDQDLIVRRAPMALKVGETIYPSLAAELLRVAQGARTIILRASGASGQTAFGERTGLNAVKIGAATLPLDAGGHLRLRYAREAPGRVIPAWALLDGTAAPEAFDGAIVLLGTSAAGLLDLRASPLNPAMPGYEAHATALEQALLEDFLERPDWALGAEIGGLALIGGALILLVGGLGALAAALAGAVALAGAGAASWFAYAQYGLLLDPVLPGAALIVVYLVGSLAAYLRVEAERRQVRSAFARYLSPALVGQLAADPSRLKLGGERREMTILFCDVRGFTTISESFRDDPEGLTRLINRLLTPLTEELLARRATIDKYMGDCIMAFWNAPLDDPDHAEHGCQGALAMLNALDKLNDALAQEAAASGQPARRLAIGVGLNTGNCVVGNMGSQQRFDYSVLGDAVNLASRLEGQSKTYGVHIVIGDETQRRLPGWATLELDLIAVKGKKEPVRVHTVLGGPDVAAHPDFPRRRACHDAMLAAYRAQDWDGADAALTQAAAFAQDIPGFYALYRERVAAFRLDPPGPDWSGVYVATSK